MTVSLPDRPLVVPVAVDDLADVVDVLVDNVFAHTPDGTAFEVALTVDGPDAVLVVADHGPASAPVPHPAGWGAPDWGSTSPGVPPPPPAATCGSPRRPAAAPGWRSGCR